jgi:hypothetical protein
VNVYYGFRDNGMNDAPVNALSYALKNDELIKSRDNLDYHRCPAFRDFFKNTYAVLSPHDYTLQIAGDQKQSTDYDQAYYESVIEDRGNLFFSFLQPELFLFCEKSLTVEQIPAFYSSAQNPDLMLVSGQYDIGKHFRKIEYAAIAKKDTTFTASEGEPLYYLRFQTNEKINFKRFFYTPEMDSIFKSTMKIRNYCGKGKVKPLSFFYEKTHKYFYDKKLLKLIKANLLG